MQHTTQVHADATTPLCSPDAAGTSTLHPFRLRKPTRTSLCKGMVLGLFCTIAFLMSTQNFQVTTYFAPDETMRYQLVDYLYRYGRLPHGGDPLLQSIWGFSYAFMPYLSAMVSAAFLKIASLFTQDAGLLIIAARFVSVVCGAVAVVYLFKIADKLFASAWKWFFVCSIAFLPQFVYISSYINNDSMAMMSIAMILYYWLLGDETNWNTHAIVGLSVGLSICILSYYNDYGFVLMSVVYYFISQAIKQADKAVVLRKAACIVLVCFIMAGWFFIWNAYLYNGDFLGLQTRLAYREQYAADFILEMTTLSQEGHSIWYMFFATDWVVLTVASFIAVFGSMEVLVDVWVYLYHCLLYFAGVALFCVGGIAAARTRRQAADKPLILFEVCTLVGGLIAVLLSIYYSYTSDFQPQGRYIIAFVFPLVYAMTRGFERCKLLQNQKWGRYLPTLLCCCNACILVFCWARYLR